MTIPTQFSWKKIDQPKFSPLNLLASAIEDDVEEQQAAIAKGYDEGFAKGRDAGEAAAAEHLRDLTAQCENLLAEMQIAREATTRRLFNDIKATYTDLFRVLFDYELTVSAELLTHLVKRAEDYLAGTCLRVHVHSSHEQALRDALQASNLADLLIVDDTIAPGAVGVSDDLNLVALDPVAGFEAILQSMAEPELLESADADSGLNNNRPDTESGTDHDDQ